MGDRWIGMLLKLFFFFFLEGGSFLWRRLCLVSVAMDPIYNTPITHYRGYSSYCDVRGTKQTCMSNWLTHRLCLQIVSLGKDCAGGVWLQRNSKIASSDLNFHLQSHENVGHRLPQIQHLWVLNPFDCTKKGSGISRHWMGIKQNFLGERKFQQYSG